MDKLCNAAGKYFLYKLDLADNIYIDYFIEIII